MADESTLSDKQKAIAPIAAFAAAGAMVPLDDALNRGLDAGLSVSDAREILVQLYAYAGFPRALNALGQLMKTLDARRQRGIDDALGRSPSADSPTGEALLNAGTANQTKLAGSPVVGPLFDFAPAIDRFLKTHLFGDIFERDNLDWVSRELATVGMLAAISGVESQLLAHVRISLNVGLSPAQLRELAHALAEAGDTAAAVRIRVAIDQHLAAAK
ncbi:carboxymuconolactone decarboxylase family protein [Burkholderia sp. Bp9017]|uniref:carboxymuconolactone decarboxylase family protein n=1 Tax=unclassified Burkholderia TaxID=2613784 RepID=UPI000F5EE40B|nr:MULTISPECIES: carboxymuconolactone decarboxylase family protein [unclassified Burkholderia]RQZ31674.1 carboxymuconolactone decarboxylase family protein [Burkholderia sp. Bp9017]RQZ37805.1 carboxymuconolactone decarboxylase family protein [Burkholderia sp. Bp9016]